MNWRRPAGLHWRDLALAVLVLAVIVAVTVSYVSSERTIYESDYFGYQGITQDVAARFRQSPLAGLRSIAVSSTQEYNALFTIPLLLPVLIFGESRLTFELALAVVYLWPFALAMGALAAQLARTRPRVMFWAAVLAALLTPMVWVPTLRGYPDTGGMLLVVVAMWLYLRHPELERVRDIVLIGLLLALAAIFRRHFAYAGLVFLGGVALSLTFGGRFVVDGLRLPLPLAARRITLTGFASLAALALLDPPFLIRSVTTNYNALYASYMRPPLDSLGWDVAAYGTLAVAVAVSGLVFAARRGVLTLHGTTFVGSFLGLSVLLWLLVVRQTGEQYTLHFTPAIVAGTAAWLAGWWVGVGGLAAGLASAATAVYLAANVTLALTGVTTRLPTGFGAVLAFSEPPLRRGDVEQIDALVTFLREEAGSRRVFVAISSPILSPAVLFSAERAMFGAGQARLNLVAAPQIDSRDGLPLPGLLEAEYVVLGRPLGQSLESHQQRVVKAVFEEFDRPGELRRDFSPLPTGFVLDGGVQVQVLKRTRPTSLDTALRSLADMERYVGTGSAGQPDWLPLNGAPGTTVYQRKGTYEVTRAGAADGPWWLAFAHTRSTPPDAVFHATLSQGSARCPGLEMAASTLDGQGRVLSAVRPGLDGMGPWNIDVPMASAQRDTVLLVFSGPADAGGCSFGVSNLILTARSN